MNANDYLKFLKYEGPTEPSLDNLRELTKLHKFNVPYSNLRMYENPKVDIPLELEVAYTQLIESGTGICYEINAVFVWLLKELGYDVYFSNAAIHGKGGALSESHLHMVPIVTLDGALYFVDPGFYAFGPIKVEHMSVYNSDYNAYRFINHPTLGENYLMFQKHFKTVLNAKGEVQIQGPSKEKFEACKTTPECCSEHSKHWHPMLDFCTIPQTLDDFKPCWKNLQETSESLRVKRVIMLKYSENPPTFHNVFGTDYEEMIAVDPIIDKIIVVKPMKTNQAILEVAEKHLGIKIKKPFLFYPEEN